MNSSTGLDSDLFSKWSITYPERNSTLHPVNQHRFLYDAELLKPPRILVIWNAMKIANECTMVTIALAALVQPVLARTPVDCATTKVIITSAPAGDRSVRIEEHLSFWIDDEAKTLWFSDGRPLRVTRFDTYWISADREDIQYEFSRGDGTLTYAGSTTEGNTTTTIVGSGQCEIAPTGAFD